MNMESSAGEIPEEVLFEILVRLPVKSLSRFRSVSTSWLSLISDPYFIRRHYGHSRTSRKLLLMEPGPLSHWYIYDPDPLKQVRAGKFPDDLLEWSRPSPSVHGLVCLLRRGGGYIDILNPSTGENICISRPGAISISTNSFSSHCFGFDPVSGKHKIIYFYGTLDQQSQLPTGEVEPWVFTLGSAEKWRRIRVLNGYYYGKSSGEVCIDGVIYLLATNIGTAEDNLAAFDLKSESFQIVNVSPRFPEIWWCSPPARLIEFNGSVALATAYLGTRNQRTIEVWVLEDFHKQVWNLTISILAPESWLGTIPRECSLYLACALRGGELLVFKPIVGDRSSDLLFCDTKNNQFWRTGIRVLQQGLRMVTCSDHVESLLPLGRN